MDDITLPPLQHAVLELVAARWRLGEHAWTISTKCRPAVEGLARRGLVGWKEGTVYQTLLVWLTEQGRAAALTDTYVPPILAPVIALQQQWAGLDPIHSYGDGDYAVSAEESILRRAAAPALAEALRRT